MPFFYIITSHLILKCFLKCFLAYQNKTTPQFRHLQLQLQVQPNLQLQVQLTDYSRNGAVIPKLWRKPYERYDNRI